MNILLGNSDKQIAQAETRVEEIRRELAELKVATERDMDLAEGYRKEGWAFALKILNGEMIRLATLRMTLPIEDVDAHKRIEGQYLEASLLAGTSSEVEQRINDGLRKQAGLRDSLGEELNKLTKLRSKR
jgi:hypothetical protein